MRIQIVLSTCTYLLFPSGSGLQAGRAKNLAICSFVEPAQGVGSITYEPSHPAQAADATRCDDAGWTLGALAWCGCLPAQLASPCRSVHLRYANALHSGTYIVSSKPEYTMPPSGVRQKPPLPPLGGAGFDSWTGGGDPRSQAQVNPTKRMWVPRTPSPHYRCT